MKKRIASIFVMVAMILTLFSNVFVVGVSATMGDYGGNLTGATWYWPLHGFDSQSSAYSKITSSYGYRGGSYASYHKGMDISASKGTAVYPTRNGTVYLADNSTDGSEGRSIIINHGDGYYSAYYHLSSVNVYSGQWVDINTQIGAVGGSGYNSESYYANHLHLAIHYGSSWNYTCSVNPCPEGYTRIGSSMQASAGGYAIGSATISYSITTTPSTPVISSITANSKSSVSLKWNSVSGASSYKIYRRTPDESWAGLAPIATTSSTSYTDNNLKNGQKYYYRVTAVGTSSAESEQSETVAIYTLPTEPSALKASSISKSDLTLSWGAVSSATKYNIYRRLPGESWAGRKPIASTTSTSYKDSGLTAGQKYYYRVTAVNDGGEGEQSESFEVLTAPTEPNIPIASAIKNTSVTIKWNTVESATSYNIYRRLAGESWAGLSPIAKTTSTSFTDSTVKQGTHYYYRITAVNSSAEGEQSESLSVYTAYIVSYNLNGGTGSIASMYKQYDTTLTLSTTKPSRTGYAFKNWNTKADGAGTSYSSGASYTSNSAVTLYAQWTANIYKVAFDTNGGSGVPSNQTKTHGKTLTLSTSIPTKTGYAFKNWNTKADGTGTSYSSGASYTANEDVTLYAQWEYIPPHTETSVTKQNEKLSITTTLFNITSGNIIVAGYNGDKLIDCVEKDYDSDNETFELTGDIDNIKVMVWDKINSMTPITTAEVIPQSDWIIE